MEKNRMVRDIGKMTILLESEAEEMEEEERK